MLAPWMEWEYGTLAAVPAAPYPQIGRGWEVEGTANKGNILQGVDVSSVRENGGAWKPKASVAN